MNIRATIDGAVADHARSVHQPAVGQPMNDAEWKLLNEGGFVRAIEEGEPEGLDDAGRELVQWRAATQVSPSLPARR